MNCQNVRSVIDTASRREPMSGSLETHLSGCHNCRSYSDEMSSLLALLSAQPRVEAPADFDFRLRARIARAQSEPATPAAIFERLWERFWARSSSSLSWGQAVTATATLALIATFSALHYSGRNQPITTTSTDNRAGTVAKSTPKDESPAITSTPITTDRIVRSSVVKNSASSSSRASAPEVRLKAVSGTRTVTAGNEYTWRGFNPEKGQIVIPSNRDLVGAENSSSTMAKTVAFVPSI